MALKTAWTVILSVTLLFSLSTTSNVAVWNTLHACASPVTAESPRVILQPGTVGSSTVYANNTSAKVDVTAARWNVQSGTGYIPAGETYTIVDIEPVNLSRSFLLISFGGGISGSQPEQDVIVSGSFASASQLRFERVGTSNPANFGWYVIEALGIQISVQSGTTQFDQTETQKDVLIEDVGDFGRCIIVLSRRSTGTDRTQYNKAFVTGELTSTTNLRLRREGTGTTVTVEWFVVKFNDDTVIQTGETIVSTSNPTSQSINPVNTSRAWLYFTWRATANGLAQVSVRGWLENSGEIRFFRQTNTGTCYVRWFVIEMPSGISIQRGFHDSTTRTEYVKNIGIAPVDLDTAFSFTTCDSTGTGNAFPRPFWVESITNATNLHLQRWYTGQTSDHNWQVIELGRANYDFVLKIVNHASESWKVRLRAYTQSNIERLVNCTVYFRNETSASVQIQILNGEYGQHYGEWCDLAGIGTIYLAMKVSAKNLETTCIYAFLEVLVPNTTTYNLMVIEFRIS